GCDHPIEPSILALAHGAAIVSRHGPPEWAEHSLPGGRRRDNRRLPGVAAVFGAEQIASEEDEASMTKCVLQLSRRVGLKQRPAIAGTKDRTVAQLHHAGVLRTAKGIGVDQFGRLTPALAVVARPHEHQVTV